MDAAEDLMRESGSGAVTVRSLADFAGLKPQLVHYYFHSMEDLLLAVVSRSCDRYLVRQATALDAPNPVRALWELVLRPEGIRLEIEFLSLAGRYESIRDALGDYMSRSRDLQVEALRERLERIDAPIANISAEAIPVILRGIAKAVVLERQTGATRGHAEALGAIETYLRLFDPKQ